MFSHIAAEHICLHVSFFHTFSHSAAERIFFIFVSTCFFTNCGGTHFFKCCSHYVHMFSPDFHMFFTYCGGTHLFTHVFTCFHIMFTCFTHVFHILRRNTCFHIWFHNFHIFVYILIMLADSQPSIDLNIANVEAVNQFPIRFDFLTMSTDSMNRFVDLSNLD
jgi:hypothetical protein